MNISVYSRNRLFKTFEPWGVPRDFADTMANYLIYGYEPGSCLTAVLANDFIGAMRSSHPSNTVEAFKDLAGWIREHMPVEAYGNGFAVKHWLALTDDDRRAVLEYHRLIYTAKEETWLALKGEEEFA